MKESYNIIFMGTPEFAIPALTALHESNHHLSLVVTQPDRPKGRGRKVMPPPVKQTAIDLGCKITQPASIKTEAFTDIVRQHRPDFLMVVAYGRILSKNILQLPKVGTINLHASLLPKYRGPAPIQWAIINRESVTGVTTMLMGEGLDTGDILLAAQEKILPVDNSATLHDRLAVLGADLLVKTLNQFSDGSIRPVPQDHSKATYAPLLKKSDGRIKWDQPAETICAFIRGMTPWPGAFTFHESKRFKIFNAKALKADVSQAPGTVLRGFADELRVATTKGVLSILEIQSASGKQMKVADFLRGYSMPPGTLLNS
ncbi:MAG: methionyl-tRNA formyltransferase [Desulfobacterales bacterium]|jgi:methionyl-tRNA formyltransferase